VAPTTYAAHGFTIESEVAVPVWAPAAPGRADLVVELVDEIPGAVGEQRLVHEALHNAETTSVLFDGVGYEIRFSRLTRMWVRADGGAVSVEPAPVEVLSWLLAGTGVAVAMAARGEVVLHATAVSLDGCAVALVAPATGGKSTAAAMLVSAGALLVSEDVVRCAVGASGWMVHPGSRAIRLRRVEDEVRALVPGASFSVSSDGRVLVHPGVVEQPAPLRALVNVVLDPSASAPRVSPAGRAAGVPTLLASLRAPLLGEPAMLEHQFDQVSSLVSDVPLWSLVIPWSAVPTPDLARRVRDVIDAALAQ
jgi:hypothetical protein